MGRRAKTSLETTARKGVGVKKLMADLMKGFFHKCIKSRQTEEQTDKLTYRLTHTIYLTLWLYFYIVWGERGF